jgi:magnesium transporter
MNDTARETEDDRPEVSEEVRSDVEAVVGALRPPPGSSPGTLVVDPDAPKPVIRVMAYGPGEIVERQIRDIEEVRAILGRLPVTWVNIDGLGDLNTIRRVGEIFGLHRLALEDVNTSQQRPKVEEYDEHTFIVIRMPEAPDPEARFDSEQVSIFLGTNYVLTFQERVGRDCFDPVRERLRTGRGRLRQSGGDYLAYTLIDAVIDAYFPVLERIGEEVETLEDELAEDPDASLVARVHEVKRDLLTLRRVVWPMRETVNALIRDPTPHITTTTQIYLRDCYDHAITLLDIVEVYRDIASGLHDLYLSSMSTRLNEIMKVLTIIATIFIPLGFIASLYGMNFATDASPLNMPELHWYYGYPFALALMAAVAGGLLFYFWRSGWIGGRRRRRSQRR